LSNVECQSKMPFPTNTYITNNTLCTFTRAGQGTCRGDRWERNFIEQAFVGLIWKKLECFWKLNLNW
jgi:hypothetical protein